MDSKIIDDPSNLFVNAEDCQRLSYDMLFDDSEFQNGNGHAKNKENGRDERKSEEEHQQELQKLEEEWKQKFEQAKEEAFQQGLEEGKEQGKEEALESMEEQMDAVKDALESSNNRVNNLLEELKPHMATMVFDVAEQIIGLPVKSEALKEKVATEIRKILTAIEKDIQVNVVVAATDYGFIVRALKDLPNAEHIEITSTESLNPGEYSIDTHNERIVKSFKKMLDDFREKLALENEIELEVEG